MKNLDRFKFTRQIVSEGSGIQFTLDTVRFDNSIAEVFLVSWIKEGERWINLDVSEADDFLPVYFGWKKTGREVVSVCGRALDKEALRFFLCEN